MPGTITAVTLNLPVTAWLLGRSLKETIISKQRLVWSVVLVPPAIFALIFLLF